MELKNSFAKVLKKIRIEEGLSQEKLALECGLDRTYISKLERAIHAPSLEVVFLIAKELNCEPSSIVMQVEEITSSNKNKTDR